MRSRNGTSATRAGLVAFFLALMPLAAVRAEEPATFKAGAATTNISPWLGLSMNGGMSDNPTTHVHDELHARAIVLDDGKARIAFVIVDSCMIPREVVEAAKRRIQKRTGIAPDHVLISATHAHSAPAAAPVFQTDADPAYVKFLATRVADAVAFAGNNLAPAQVGWGMGRNVDQLFNRRWRKKPGTIPPDPFGKTNDQVQMNPPPGSPDLIEPAGPVDPEVGVLAVRKADGTPIAVLSAYGLHYVGGVGGGHASADYYGAFARKARELLGMTQSSPPFVAAMANGTSGDVNNINFRTPRPAAGPYEQINRVADDLAAEVVRVVKSIEYHDHATLDAATAELSLGVRRPDSDEAARATKILAAASAAGKPLQSLEQVYARETVLLEKYPAEVPVTIQCLRVGDLGIAAIPCEVFTEIGLEIKAKSPFKPTFTIELANGYNGYLPTPSQHALGGYETWRARSSYLETDASTKITDAVLKLFDKLKTP